MKKMTMKKTTLLTSGFAMLVSASMLIGTTYAWFTDNAQVTVNKIVVGTLDVAIVGEDGTELSELVLPENALWEPGCTYTFPAFHVKNNGSLSLRYKVVVDGADKLGDLIEWSYNGLKTDAAIVLAPDAQSDAIMVTGHMKETVTGVDVQGKTFDGLTIKVYATQNNNNATFDDTTKEDDVEATPGTLEELKSLFELAAQGGANVTINLEQDFDAANGWTAFSPKGYNGVNTLTINGNGHTIKGLNAPLTMGAFAGDGKIVINDLTIEGASISAAKYNGLGLGAFVAYSDASGGVELKNCKLVTSTVECTDGYAGGLVGYTSTPATLTGCSVAGSTIKGANSSGALAGQFAAAATVSGCSASGNTVSSSNAGDWRVGVIVGTANVGTVTMTNITASDNKLEQTDKTGPETAHSDLYGRSLGDGITLDGASI